MTDKSKVFEFPSKAVRDWTQIERSIAEACLSNGFSKATEERLIGVMKPFWESLDPGMNFTLDIPLPAYITAEDRRAILDHVSAEVSRANSDALQRFTRRLCVERLTREMQFLDDMGLLP